MSAETMLPVAFQSALLLGLIHGVNPCGHSWLVLAPFISGRRNGRKVLAVTLAFLFGTTLASILIGLSLGAVSSFFAVGMRLYIDIFVNAMVIILGVLLVVRPKLIHSHDHDQHSHDHDQHSHEHEHHSHDHGHDDNNCSSCGHYPENSAGCKCTAHLHSAGLADRISNFMQGRSSVLALFVIGFVNMLVPCPTLAMMYSYALDSESPFFSSVVFAGYSFTTAITVGIIVFAIYKVSSLVRSLSQEWIEIAVLRSIGILTVAFGLYSLYADLGV